MPLVTITGKAWDGGRDPIPAVQQPRLWFRPVNGAFVGAGLHTNDEVRADLQPDGSFTVQLESEPGLLWEAELDALPPGQETEPPRNRARAHSRWPAFWPGTGGDISALIPWPSIRGVIFGFGPLTEWPWPTVYLDLADPDGIGVYGVAGAYVEGDA